MSHGAQLGPLPLRQHASKLLTLSEEFAVDLEHLFAFGKADHPFFFLMVASRSAYKRKITLNSVHQHN